MGQTLYLVVADGWILGYGSQMYCLGIFDSKSVAEKISEEYRSKTNVSVIISEIEMNQEYPLRKDEFYGYINENYLGGYFE